MDVNDSQSLACVRPFVRLADDMGIGVLAVITKIDEYDPALATKPTEVYKNERLHHKVREAAATNLCLQLMNVLCVKNYVAESSTTPQVMSQLCRHFCPRSKKCSSNAFKNKKHTIQNRLTN